MLITPFSTLPSVYVYSVPINEQSVPLESFTYLKQVHGKTVVEVDSRPKTLIEADGLFHSVYGRVCQVRTADCVPILAASRQTPWVAAVHAGWRGVYQGIQHELLKYAPLGASDLSIWLGPAISGEAYAVGDDLAKAFQQQRSSWSPYIEKRSEQWHLDLRGMLSNDFKEAGIPEIIASPVCTYRDLWYHSVRRQGLNHTGRNVSGIIRLAPGQPKTDIWSILGFENAESAPIL